MAYRRAFTGPGEILLVIDHTDTDTPAMVYSKEGNTSATFFCALDTGELCGPRGWTEQLSPGQLEWLGKYEEEASQAYDIVAER